MAAAFDGVNRNSFFPRIDDGPPGNGAGRAGCPMGPPVLLTISTTHNPATDLGYLLQGLTQPAVKCRGREYLRIIYGPDYASDEHLSRLRSRGLGAKRSLALREFALGIEALERFVRREPLRRVHECVFGVLALESEPVDPRL